MTPRTAESLLRAYVATYQLAKASGVLFPRIVYEAPTFEGVDFWSMIECEEGGWVIEVRRSERLRERLVYFKEIGTVLFVKGRDGFSPMAEVRDVVMVKGESL